MKKIIYVFIIAFFLNLLWENLHSYLYTVHMGGEITPMVLIVASLGDAVIITFMVLPFLFTESFRKRSWLIAPIGVSIGILIELYALNVERWSYSELMPLVPFLSVGWTPTIQLGLLGYLSYWLATRMRV